MRAQAGGRTCRCFFAGGQTAIAPSCWPEQRAAIVALDQVGNAEGCPIAQVRTFQMHFALTDQGELALDRFGEGSKEEAASLAVALSRARR